MSVVKSKRSKSRLEVIHNYYKTMSKRQRVNMDNLIKELTNKEN